MDTSTQAILARSNVHVSGGGPQAVVFLHGLGCNQNMWRRLAPAFEADYQVVLLDLVGAGQSDLRAYSRRRHGTLEGHARDLLDVLRALDLHQVVFVGHSISAMIGVLAAIEEPARFARLVLVSPSPRFLNGKDYLGGFEQADINELLEAMETDYSGWAHAFPAMLTGAQEYPELAMELSNSFVRTNPEIARHFARVAFLSDSRASLPLVDIPTLIVQAARDVVAPLAVGHYLNEQLPDSRIAIVDTAGHCPHLTAPEKTLEAIEHFLHLEAVPR